jgi:hypothetical protein
VDASIHDSPNSWTKGLAPPARGSYGDCGAREVPLDPSPEVTLEGALDSALDLSLDLRR